MLYKKLFSRDNCFLLFEVWLEGEKHTENHFLLNRDGVISAYYREKDFARLKREISFVLRDKKFFEEIKATFRDFFPKYKFYWQKIPADVSEVIKFYERAAEAWKFLNIFYYILKIKKTKKPHFDEALKVRNATFNFWDDADKIFDRGLRKIYPRLGDLIRVISIGELRKNRIPRVKILKSRAGYFIYHKGKIISTPLASFLKSNGFKIEVSKSKSIKGTSAARGMVTGKARVVLRKSDIKKVRKGEILVASMTTPDYFPALKNAAGIVTDEGGLTSHAAIIARELGKPCIVGTKSATDSIKNGEIIVVDAIRGRVRRL